MIHTYNITGMTCNGCVAKVKKELLQAPGITAVEVQLAAPQATITMSGHVPIEALQTALTKAGAYSISEADGGMHHSVDVEETKTWFETYKPLLLILLYLLFVTIVAASTSAGFDWMTAMRVFMSGFFLTFSFFKLLDLTGFADSYGTYDIIAKKFRPWGFIYPFVELALGIAYAINISPVVTNVVTFAVMSISIIGVLQSVLNKRKIRCACLGAVFNLPMSTVTIVEDALMIAMSGVMIAALI